MMYSRFLRARNWDVLAAQKQFADYKVWLKKHNVLQVLRDLSPADMLRTQRYYPRWTGRRDKVWIHSTTCSGGLISKNILLCGFKLGNPIFVYRVASLKPLQEEIFEVPPETRYERVSVPIRRLLDVSRTYAHFNILSAALVEYMTLFYLPLCTHLPHSTEPTPISSTTTIVDLEGVSLNLVWKLRSLFQEAFRMNSENYPETMSKVVIINLPWFFSTIWDWVKVSSKRRVDGKPCHSSNTRVGAMSTCAARFTY